MTNRLTPEALDALLAEHHEVEGMCIRCSDANMGGWTKRVHFPCTIYLLASEVRDARQLAERTKKAKALVHEVHKPQLEAYSCECRDGNDDTDPGDDCKLAEAWSWLNLALAHYEEGTK